MVVVGVGVWWGLRAFRNMRDLEVEVGLKRVVEEEEQWGDKG